MRVRELPPTLTAEEFERLVRECEIRRQDHLAACQRVDALLAAGNELAVSVVPFLSYIKTAATTDLLGKHGKRLLAALQAWRAAGGGVVE